MTIPILETERLRLRAHQAADLAPLLAMWQQPQFYQYITGQPAAEDEVWPRLLRDTGLWAVCGFGYWAIEEKATGTYVGTVGFADFRRAIAAELGQCPEVGWSLAPRAQGQGYATEALAAALTWGDAHLPQPRTVCLIHVDNQPSLRLAARLGYQEFGRTVFKTQPVVLLERQAPG
jgi:RimJ/RimL family protein N-acetyltransferase